MFGWWLGCTGATTDPGSTSGDTGPVGEVPNADLVVCYGGDLPMADTGGADLIEDLTLTVQAIDPVGAGVYDGVRCGADPWRGVSLSDGANTVHLTWGWTGDPPAVALAPGDTVDVAIRLRRSFGTSLGFVIRRAGALVAAVEGGAWGPGLDAADLPELPVTLGEVRAVVPTGCGDASVHALDFGGTVVEPSGTATTPLGTAYWLAAHEGSFDGCADVVGETSWAVFAP